MKTIVLLALIAFAATTANSAPSDTSTVDCSKLDEVVDDLSAAQSITTLSDKYKLTTTREEMEKKCALSKDVIKTLKKYNNKCNTALTQQVFSAILRTRLELIEETCKDPTSAQFNSVLESIKCVHDNAFEALKGAEKNIVLMSQVLYEAKIENEKERIKRACCGVLESKKLFLAASRDKCGAYEKVYASYVDSYTSESLGLICPDAEKMEKDGDCKQLSPLTYDPNQALKSVSFLNPMLKLVKTLDH